MGSGGIPSSAATTSLLLRANCARFTLNSMRSGIRPPANALLETTTTITHTITSRWTRTQCSADMVLYALGLWRQFLHVPARTRTLQRASQCRRSHVDIARREPATLFTSTPAMGLSPNQMRVDRVCCCWRGGGAGHPMVSDWGPVWSGTPAREVPGACGVEFVPKPADMAKVVGGGGPLTAREEQSSRASRGDLKTNCPSTRSYCIYLLIPALANKSFTISNNMTN